MQQNKERLDSLATLILENLEAEQQSADSLKWERAGLYLEARELFPSDPLFGRWVKSYFAGAGKQENNSTISRLMNFRRYLSREQFMAIGYAKSAELMNLEVLRDYPQEMAELISVAHKMSQREIRKAVASIEKGEGFTPPPKTKDEYEAEISSLKIELGIFKNTYRFSEEEFFHPDTSFKELQLGELAKGGKYACLFFGVNTTSDITEEVIRNNYRRLSFKYHPDRGGDEEIMVAINKLVAHFENVLSLK